MNRENQESQESQEKKVIHDEPFTARFGVIGDPVTHSRSPEIHRCFAEQLHIALEYNAYCVSENKLAEFVSQFFDQGGQGLNVTAPLKQAVMALCYRLTQRAELAGAVNTLYLDEHLNLCGDNTDGQGLVDDFIAHDITIAGKSLLILGAGGAVRGILGPLLDHAPKTIVIANRSLARPEALLPLFAHSSSLKICTYDDLAGEFDIVINATSGGIDAIGQVAHFDCGHRTIAYDLNYGTRSETFITWMKNKGCSQVLSGEGMLIRQAAESFKLWHQKAPVISQCNFSFLGG